MIWNLKRGKVVLPKRGKKFIFNSHIKFEEELSQLVKNLNSKKKLKNK